MRELINLYLQKEIKSKRFADQFFLREYIWPYAKESLLEYDTVFSFWQNRQTSNHPIDKETFHIGSMDSSIFSATTKKENGTKIKWELYEINNPEIPFATISVS